MKMNPATVGLALCIAGAALATLVVLLPPRRRASAGGRATPANKPVSPPCPLSPERVAFAMHGAGVELVSREGNVLTGWRGMRPTTAVRAKQGPGVAVWTFSVHPSNGKSLSTTGCGWDVPTTTAFLAALMEAADPLEPFGGDAVLEDVATRFLGAR